MSAQVMISDATRSRFDKEVVKYPVDQKQSAVMACLAIVQQEQGFVSGESEKLVAEYLGMPPIAVHEVTTFYNMYNQQAIGKYKFKASCPLRNWHGRLVQTLNLYLPSACWLYML